MPAKAKPDTFAARVQRLRLAAGLTQASLAAATGLSQQTIQWIEQRPGCDPKWSSVCKLADALGVSLDELRA